MTTSTRVDSVEVKVLGRDETRQTRLVDQRAARRTGRDSASARHRAAKAPSFEAKLRSFMRDAKERTTAGGKKPATATKRKK